MLRPMQSTTPHTPLLYSKSGVYSGTIYICVLINSALKKLIVGTHQNCLAVTRQF